MSPRTGRPKLENPAIVYTSIQLDTETAKRLEMHCKKNGLTKGKVIRTAIIQYLDKKEE